MLPGPSANSWPSIACPVCCQMDWRGSFQAGRVNGLAYFGHNMNAGCFPDLGSTSNISCSNPGIFPWPHLGAPSSTLGGLTADQLLCLLKDKHDLNIKFLSRFNETLQILSLRFPQSIIFTPSRAWTEQALAVPAGMVAATGADAVAVGASRSVALAACGGARLEPFGDMWWWPSSQLLWCTSGQLSQDSSTAEGWGPGWLGFCLYFILCFPLGVPVQTMAMKRTNSPLVTLCMCACVRACARVCMWKKEGQINWSIDWFTTLEDEWSPFLSFVPFWTNQHLKSCNKCVANLYFFQSSP